MKFQPQLLSASLIALSTLSTNALSQEHEHRAHGSHEHGAAKLDIILAGNELAFEWVTPAANLLGFEHQAKTDEQKQKVNEVAALLTDPSNIVDLPESAGCSLGSSQINSDLLMAEKEHHDEHEHEDEHDHEHADEHEHEHENEHEHEENHAGEHEHEKNHSTHADIAVSYLFNCSNPSAITQLPVTLFEHFPLTEKVQVQGIINDKQLATSLSPDNNSITW